MMLGILFLTLLEGAVNLFQHLALTDLSDIFRVNVCRKMIMASSALLL